ncbi:helix-turn-helix transcriptional regulator [Coraliomargarita sp. SDUM461004]|uniref:Helix-turn-helix transcriptional regulator n=1 Tax=Thalassobacterium sedimentorum TaxID=3041258 RepID=A0ABU1AFN4_9BACT|nr:helix-turn-helix transcriptional regulator [Coraliomargarita sp. SDUM461004]MDQ8193617.1 helix-turn-helix transcriptional regulator [Coraliomargarita sp. SDUM461004]
MPQHLAQSSSTTSAQDSGMLMIHPQLESYQWLILNKQGPKQIFPGNKRGVRLLAVTEQAIQVIENDVTHVLETNSVFYCRPKLQLQIRAAQDIKTRVLELNFKDALSCSYLDELQRQYGRKLRIPPNLKAIHATQQLAQRNPSPKEVFYWISMLHEFAEQGRLNLGKLLAGGPDTLSTIAKRNQFSLKSIAYALNCPASHLLKCWKNRGYPPLVQLLRTQRMALVKQLLSESEMGLQTIARLCGYSGASAFCAAFRTAENTTPSQWRTTNSTKPTPPAKISQSTQPKKSPAPKANQDQNPICLWGLPYFQFDGGLTNSEYKKPFNLAMNSITSAICWVYTLEGHALFEVDGHKLDVGPNTVVIHPKPMFGRWSTPDGKPWSRIWLQMRDPWSLQTMHYLTKKHGWVLKIPQDSAPVKMARKWVNRWNAGRGAPSVERSQIAHDWLCTWESLLTSNAVQSVSFPDLRQFESPEFYRKIGKINDYAKSIGYSRSYLTRCLRRQWQGGTPAQIVRRHRLAQAATELTNTNESISRIASNALYANTSAFITAFKREYNCTPLAYRYQHNS